MNNNSSSLHNAARTLRLEGKTFREISKALLLPLSTTHKWTRDIKLSPQQQELISRRHRKKFIEARIQLAHKRKRERVLREDLVIQEAIKNLPFSQENEFFIAGLSLYWAEGFKKDHSLGFVNSDPNMIVFFVKWLLKFGSISKEGLKFRVHIHETYKPYIGKVEEYWSKLLEVKTDQFQEPFFQRSKKVYPSIDLNYKGLLRVRAPGSRVFFTKILGWIQGLQRSDLSKLT